MFASVDGNSRRKGPPHLEVIGLCSGVRCRYYTHRAVVPLLSKGFDDLDLAVTLPA